MSPAAEPGLAAYGNPLADGGEQASLPDVMFGIVPDGPGPGTRPAFIHPVRRWSGEGHPLADGDDGEGEGSGNGGGDDDEDDDWWEDIWDFLRCGDVRDRLGSEYGVGGRLLCWAFWLHGPKWIVPGSQGIEYGVPHGEWGLMFASMKKLVGDMERHFGINAGITSGYRCPIGNGTIPGAERESQHTSGTAYDFVVPGWTDDQKEEIVRWVIRQGGGKYAEHYPGNRRKPHIHMQLYPNNPLFDQETDQ